MTEMQHHPKYALAAGILGAAILAIGIAIAGALVGGSSDEEEAAKANGAESRGITVVGTAERMVTADMAIWPVTVNASGVDLGEAQTQLDREVDSLLVFLVGEGIDQNTIDLGRPEVIDLLAQSVRPIGVADDVRYLLTQAVTVRSADVITVSRAAGRIGELSKLGVDVAETKGPIYRFMGLAELKPELIAEAVEAARAAASGVVTPADGTLGAIRRAQEGELIVEPRDGPSFGPASTALEKRVLLSTTVEFVLND
jgi:hypothetical protein